MNVDALFIGRLAIDTETFLGASKEVLGRSLSKKLDAQGKDVTSVSGYLALLSALKNPDLDFNLILENPGSLLQHQFYVFLIACSRNTLNELLEETKLSIQSAESNSGIMLAVISGTLEDWRSAIINICSEKTSFNLRLLFDKILLLFEQEGLSRLWSQYTKKTLPDKTFKLLERK